MKNVHGTPYACSFFGQFFENYKDQLSSRIHSYRDVGLAVVNFGYILIRQSAELDTNTILQRGRRGKSSDGLVVRSENALATHC